MYAYIIFPVFLKIDGILAAGGGFWGVYPGSLLRWYPHPAIWPIPWIDHYSIEPNYVWCITSHMIFLKNYSPLFIKLIFGYTYSILCKIDFWIICLTPTQNASCKKITTKSFHQELSGNQKHNIKHSILYIHWYMNIYIYHQVYTLYAYKLYWNMFVLNQMTCDELHHTWSFWIIGSPLFIKLICGYTSRIVWKYIFWFLWLTPTWN